MSALRAAAVMLWIVLPAAASVAGQEPIASAVVVYRCIARDGAVALRDTPCTADQRQQVMNLRRPVDPPPPEQDVAVPEPPPAPPPAAPEVRYVHVAPPRPMYECVTPEGDRYTSDDDAGNPRWVPYWTHGYPAWRPRQPHGPVAGPAPPQTRPPAPGHGRPDRPQRPDRPDRPQRPPATGIVPAGGMMVRDTCHMLPQQETCARLSDRRWEILRRYNSAMPGERRDLEQEQRGIDARIANDCRG